MIRDVAWARSLRDALGYMLAPPGWRPDGRGVTARELRAQGRTNWQPTGE